MLHARGVVVDAFVCAGVLRMMSGRMKINENDAGRIQHGVNSFLLAATFAVPSCSIIVEEFFFFSVKTSAVAVGLANFFRGSK